MTDTTPITDALLEKRIKKQIYGKLQRIIITYPPGLLETALAEVQAVLSEPWFAKPFTGECTPTGNQIYIEQIQMVTAVELLLRCQCITDIRLVIFTGHANGKKLFEKKCREIPWNYYIHPNMALKLKVTSIASHAFHETGLKQILGAILNEQQARIVNGEKANETTCIYADLYKDRLTVSISLAGAPLYQRGYRTALSASAPLREDAASCFLQKVLRFTSEQPDTVMIPFSGTGTFAFEFLQQHYHITTALLGRTYALQTMPLFKQNHFLFLIKQAQKKVRSNEILSPTIICIDNHPDANNALLENNKQFNLALSKHDFQPLPITQKNENFFALDFNQLISNKTINHILIPLNPPYGIRLGKNTQTVQLYKQIATKINELATHPIQTISGLILCPSESSWSIFCKTIRHSKIETYHFTQGGLDIRVCQWFYDESAQNKL